MQIGMIGLGRMGSNMVRRLAKGGHLCVVYDADPAAATALADTGASAAASLDEFVAKLAPPRAVWVMVPAAVAGRVLEQLASRLSADDIVVDGGNSYYRDDLVRARTLGSKGIHLLDCGTSGGVFGLERGFCLMIGGDAGAVSRLEPIFKSLAPEGGFLHCGPSGAGHFVKMVHNGIEYGLMAAYAEGLNILKHAGAGSRPRDQDAETTPLREPEAYRYDFNLGQVAEVWRHGSVISSWLLDLTAQALSADPELTEFSGRVSDSGEGRWTAIAALEEGVPAPVLFAALSSRFESQGGGSYAARVLSAMRKRFGGHEEKKPETSS